jgi:tetratricopeptide (TPR) repeat protein
MAVVMDREAFEYAFGDTGPPEPAQRDLDALAAGISRICVLEGPMVQGRAPSSKVLIDVDEPRAIEDLWRCLRIVEEPQTCPDCDCPGGPTMELYAGPELAAVLALHHGESIRWSHWCHDARLEDGKQLTRWLEKQGIRARMLSAIYQRRSQSGTPQATRPNRDPRVQDLATHAERHARAGAFPAALEACAELIRLAPGEAEGYAFRAKLYHHLGRLPEALADCTAAIARGTREAPVYFIRAFAAYAAEQTDQALADCSMALRIDPHHAEALDLRGCIRATRGHTREALADLDRAIRVAPGWMNAYWHRMGVHKATGNFDGITADCAKVIQILQALLAQQPPEPESAADWSDFSQPRAMLTAAYVERGQAHEAQKRLDLARKDLDEAIRVLPTALSALSARGWFRMRRAETSSALEDFTEVIRLAPEQDKGYIQRAMAHAGSRAYAEAIADSTEAIARHPGSAEAYSLRSQAHAMLGKHAEALADADRAIELAPSHVEFYWGRVRSYERQGRYEEEIAELERMLRLNPDDVATCNMLAWVLATCPDARLRDGPRAVELGRHGCGKASWKEPQIMDTLAAAYAEAGQFEEACAYEERSIKMLPPGTDTKRYLARLATYRSRQPHRTVPGDPETG